MTYTKHELIIETAAQSLYNLGTTKYPNPKKTLKLNLIKLVGLLGGKIRELTNLTDLDPNTPTVESHEDGTFTLKDRTTRTATAAFTHNKETAILENLRLTKTTLHPHRDFTTYKTPSQTALTLHIETTIH